MWMKNTNPCVSWVWRCVYLGIECRTLQGHKKYPIWGITYLCQNIHRKYSLVIYLQIFLTAEAWWIALLRDHFEVFLKKYICKMNDWHWSDFHFNFERSFLCWSENLSNIHCASFFSACHVMKRDFSLKYKMDANFDKVKFPAKLGIFGRHRGGELRLRKVSRPTGFEWGSKSYWHWNVMRGIEAYMGHQPFLSTRWKTLLWTEILRYSG